MRFPKHLVLLSISCAVLSAQTRFLKPEGLGPANGYSHVVVTGPGKTIYIAGQVAMNREGKLVGKGDLKVQAEQVFENLQIALASAGATFQHVVKINWYVKGFAPDQLPVLRDVRNRYINTAAPPASTLVGVAALFQDECLLEVEAVAVLPGK